MASVLPPAGQIPPLCLCGCGLSVRWRAGVGWQRYAVGGHNRRGKPGPRRGAITPETTKQKQREAQRANWAGRRKRDLEDEPGRGVYSSWEYRESRRLLIEGKPCSQCGSVENVCAHHMRAGDDSSLVPLCKECHPTYQVAPWYKRGESAPEQSLINPAVYEGKDLAEALGRLVADRPCIRCGAAGDIKGHHRVQGDHESLIPLCRSCHGWIHAHEPPYNPRGQHPPPGEQPPLCACGCGKPVRWKRVRGWGRFLHGHACAKVPAGTRIQEAPLCACGCGRPVAFRHGKGWNTYKRGHVPGSVMREARKRNRKQ